MSPRLQGASWSVGAGSGARTSGQCWTSHGGPPRSFPAVSWGRNYRCRIPELEETVSSYTDGRTEAKQDVTCLRRRRLGAELGLSLPDDIQVLSLASLPGGCVLSFRLATPTPPNPALLGAFVQL